MPEGLEDCVLELPNHRFWVQIKSRNDGTFSEAEVQSIFVAIDNKAAALKSDRPTNSVVVLNQKCAERTVANMDRLLDDEWKVVLCDSPKEEIIDLLTSHLEIAVILAEGIASDLYTLVVEVSSENASVSYDERRRISTTEVERRISERLVSEDPSTINRAIASGVLEAVNFQVPIDEPSFYLGVKAKPGHVTAGLISPRRSQTSEVTKKLKERRHVLITGPSGAGKSALMWLCAHALACSFRWFQITAEATANDADSIVRFVLARRPTPTSPIGLAVDEICAANSGLWDVLLKLLWGVPEVYVLGSVRTEDIYLISNQADTGFVQLTLDDRLAESVWKKLANDDLTNWSHWREPFEQSEDLMLEFVHILTQGERLASVIGDQVRQREHEERTDELAIIRCTAELCRHGGEIDAGRLFKLLDIPPERSSIALKRLIDEHLVRESRPDVLGGLHMLRSEALCAASHDGAVYTQSNSLWLGFLSVTNETLPRVVRSVLTESERQDDELTLQKLGETLASSADVEKWAAILTGLGLATLERCATLFISMLEQHSVQRAHWSLASMFIDPSTTVPNMPELEQWQAVKDAVESFRAAPKADLRSVCLEFLPTGTIAPTCKSFEEANRLLSSAVPIAGGQPVQVNISPEFTGECEQDIEQVAAFLSTAFVVDPHVADKFVEAFAGEEVLFEWFRRQTPWVATPIIDQNGEHGRTVRADFFVVADELQGDTHDTIVSICETLIALSPSSDAVASSAVNPKGGMIRAGNHPIVSKNIARENLPSKARVAWNVAFRQILLARVTDDSLTNYTQHMSVLIPETEQLFRSYSEKWIRGKRIGNADALAARINNVSQEVNALAYAEPKPVSTSMTAVVTGAAADDTLGSLLTGVLGNLVPRMNNQPTESDAKGVAVFAESLVVQAREQQKSKIWRTTSAPPLEKIKAIADRLDAVSSILHEMAYDGSEAAVRRIVDVAKRAPLGKSVHLAARRCRMKADQRLQKKLRALESALEKQGSRVKCRTRPIEAADTICWPPVEIAVLVEMSDFETDFAYLEKALLAGEEIFEQDWRFRVVPVLDGIVLPDFAIQPISEMLFSHGTVLPDVDFAADWREHIDLKFHFSEVSDAFSRAMNACVQLSGILNCRNWDEMHPEEEDTTEKIIDEFKASRELLSKSVVKTGLEELEWVLDKVDATWNQLVEEYEFAKDRREVSNPLYESMYSALSGEQSDWVNELAGARLLLRQAEIRILNESL